MKKDFTQVKTIAKNKTAILSDDGFVPHLESSHKAGLGKTSIAISTCVSSEENAPVEKGFLKPDRGIEPLGHKLTRLVTHHASGCAQFYHAGNTRYAAFADVPFYYSAQASAASTPATAGGATFLMGMPF